MAEEKGNGRLPGGIQSLMKNVQGREETPENETQYIRNPEKRAAGRPRVHEEPYERTSITLPSEMMGKLRMYCLEERKQLRDVIEEALKEFFIEIEKERGTIPIPETYRNK